MSNTPAQAAEPPAAGRRISFRTLIEEERELLRDSSEHDTGAFDTARPGLADEPWVCFTDRDHFGLALSGGGIRSATFNLGLLQALDLKGALHHVDYLSTVSGGGYAGGMWTAWRHRQAASGNGSGAQFPRQTQTADGFADSPPDHREPAEIRHLREFSRFLMPRVGFFRSEMWAGIVVILGGLIPALLATTALVTLVYYAWFPVAFFFGGRGFFAWVEPLGLTTWQPRLAEFNALQPWAALIAFAAMTFSIEHVIEREWRRSGRRVDVEKARWSFRAAGALAIIVSTAAFGWMNQVWAPGAAEQWTRAANIALFLPALAWLAAALVMFVLRGFIARPVISCDRKLYRLSAYDRAISHCLQPALLWAALSGAWCTADWLIARGETYQAATAGGPIVFGVLFVWLRDWLTQPRKETVASELLARVIQRIKPLIPQVLAAAAVASFFVAVAVGIQLAGFGPAWIFAPAAAVVILFATLLFFDPAYVGMHDFYRSRISRCFLGAAAANGNAGSRHTDEQAHDDLTLGQLDQAGLRPIHLICTTANNLAGDTLTSLYRGARSAVVSRAGVSLGNDTARYPDLRLSSALTASAAAFNSQMGRISMHLGPAVAFVMCALNLRLGLWVPHPQMENPRPPRLPGLPFFHEMLGYTRCDPLPTGSEAEGLSFESLEAATLRLMREGRHSPRVLQAAASQLRELRRLHLLHLSDGGHFENLALYELIRRHCRYIIVSDCGADPEQAFDDLATALRCIREDFGVEIELDVAPLRPDEGGRSRQHAVVGVIHYDGLAGLDKGTIVYFKPALTGDEPPDVTQYRTRNPAFPHEGTGDQFYDEAQWESYRRLGEHAGHSVFYYADGDDPTRAGFVENLFMEATRSWHAAPERQSEIFLTLTERCAELERDIRENAPPVLRMEFFPEAAALRAGASRPGETRAADSGLHVPMELTATGRAGSSAAGSERSKAADDPAKTLHFLMLITQVMEDIWIGAELDTCWSHPMNEGWMNYLQRWASTPSFRRWWPVLRPIYSAGFRDFVKERFDLRLRDVEARPHTAPGRGAQLKLGSARPANEPVLGGLASEAWQRRYQLPAPPARGDVFPANALAVDYFLTLESENGAAEMHELQVGFLVYTLEAGDSGESTARWKTGQLFVPHALSGAGIIARLLDAAIARFRKTGVTTLHVTVDDNPAESHPSGGRRSLRRPGRAARLATVRTINFYKSRGFVHERPTGAGGEVRCLTLRLDRVPADFGSWPPMEAAAAKAGKARTM